MKLRFVAALLVAVSILGACGKSSPPAPPTGTPSPADIDLQAAKACKTMEQVLADTADGQAISGSDAQQMQADSGLLIRTPDGRQPTSTEPKPSYYELGTTQVELLVAISSQDTAAVAELTPQARAGCAKVPEAAQKEANYTPVPTTP